MTSKRFLTLAASLALAVMVFGVGFSMWMNDYGLFGDVRGTNIPAVKFERMSKYLLAANYIPQNFDALLIGPSLSDNLDTSQLRKVRLYNLSINGGNIHELKILFDKVLETGTIHSIVLCLDPYLTKDYGRKEQTMFPSEYWSTLGSLDNLRLWMQKILVALGKRKLANNGYGYYDLEAATGPLNVAEEIRRHADKDRGRHRLRIDERSFKDLENLLHRSRERGINIFAYYYPPPWETYQANKEEYDHFKQRTRLLFTERDVVWDYLTPAYESFMKDVGNYCDRLHLSYKGAKRVLEDIERKLTEPALGTPPVEGTSVP